MVDREEVGEEGWAGNLVQAECLGTTSLVVSGNTGSPGVDYSGGVMAVCVAHTHNMATPITGRTSDRGTTSMVVIGQTDNSGTTSVRLKLWGDDRICCSPR